MMKVIVKEDWLRNLSHSDWLEKLQELDKFIYEASNGYRMSCRLEGRAETGNQYWSAYKKIGGKTRKKYLGQPEALTSRRLSHVANEFQVLSNSAKDTQAENKSQALKAEMSSHAVKLIEEYLDYKGLSPTGRDFKAIAKLVDWIESLSVD